MDLKYVKDLIMLLEKSGVQRMTIKEKNGVEITLDKGPGVEHVHHAPAPPKHAPAIPPAPAAGPPSALETKETPTSEEKDFDPKKCVNSPMVGTFYACASPEDPPFVKVGDLVNKGDVICIVEAMKVMNEVKSDRQGKITKVLIENGSPVEYGQPLFVIE